MESSSTNSVLKVEHSRFPECSGDEAFGEYVYISCMNGMIFVPLSQWTNTFERYDEVNYQAFWLKESRTISAQSSISLLPFLFLASSGSPVIFVSTSGSDSKTCCWNDLPCLTFQQSYSVRAERTIVDVGSGRHNSESNFDIGSSTTFTGKSKGSIPTAQPIKLITAPLFTVCSRVILTLQCLRCTQQSSSSIRSKAKLPFRIIDASTGILNLEWVTFYSFSLANTPLLKISTISPLLHLMSQQKSENLQTSHVKQVMALYVNVL